MNGGSGHVLIACARYYPDIIDAMLDGVDAVLSEAGVGCEILDVPGVFELPASIKFAAKSSDKYNGFIALGCVIRGETDHYDHVCREASRGLMELATRDGLAIGFGVLTCDTAQQAIVRADPTQKNKGGEAATACLAMMAIKTRFSGA